MPFTPEQRKAHYAAHKAELNRKRTERRRLAKLGRDTWEVGTGEDILGRDKAGIPEQVGTAREVETKLSLPENEIETIKQVGTTSEAGTPEPVETAPKVETVSLPEKVDIGGTGETKEQVRTMSLPKHKHVRLTLKPTLPQLIQAWKTQTNYACPPTCSHSYCSNCWYFAESKLIDYKGGSM